MAVAFPRSAGWVSAMVVGGLAGTPAVIIATRGWYKQIAKPSWTPPNGCFAPVWTMLYSLMGIAASQIDQKVGFNSLPLRLFLGHYVLNLCWAPIFFGLHRIGLALGVNVALVMSLLLVMREYAAVSLSASLLLVPYLCWLSFATALNFAILRMNTAKSSS